MLLSTRFKHSRDRSITFYSTYQGKTHVYRVEGETPTSVTSFIHRYFEPFSPDRIVARYYDRWQQDKTHRYYGMTKEEIKRTWKDNGQEASSLGTTMHAQIEMFFNDELPDTPKTPEFEQFLSWWRDFQHHYPTWRPYRTEWLVYDEKRRLAGCIDMVFYNTKSPNDCMLVDWKRSKDVSMTSFGGKKAHAPIDDLDDCNGTKYSLQLNTYRYILEQAYGKRIRSMRLAVFHPNQSTYLDIPIRDMSSSVTSMLK